MPNGLSPPAAENASAASSDPFADLLPDGLKVLENEDSQLPKPSRSFPVSMGLGEFDDDTEEDDMTEDILED